MPYKPESSLPPSHRNEQFGILHSLKNDHDDSDAPKRSSLRKRLLLHISSLFSKKALRKRTLVLSLILSIFSYRVGLLSAHASATLAPEETVSSEVVVPLSDDETAEIIIINNKNDEKSSSASSILAKAAGTAVLVASGAKVFRLNRKQRRENQDLQSFESWNASWNATEAEQLGEAVPVPVILNGMDSYYFNATTEMMEDIAPTMEMNSRFPKEEYEDQVKPTTPPSSWYTDRLDPQSVPKDDVMKATVEAMKRAGGESTKVVQKGSVETLPAQLEVESSKVEEPALRPPAIKQEPVATPIQVNTVEPVTAKREPSKYPKARMPIADPVERAKVSSKYAAIESLEDRAFQILLDLGMIEKTGDK